MEVYASLNVNDLKSWDLSRTYFQSSISCLHCSLNSEHWTLSTDHWTLKNDHWTLITGHWSLSTEYWALRTEHWLLSTEHRSLNIYHWTLITEHQTLGSEHWELSNEQWTLNNDYCKLNTECWALSTEHWTLITEQWSLNTDHWTLNTEYWALRTEHWALSIKHWDCVHYNSNSDSNNWSVCEWLCVKVAKGFCNVTIFAKTILRGFCLQVNNCKFNIITAYTRFVNEWNRFYFHQSFSFPSDFYFIVSFRITVTVNNSFKMFWISRFITTNRYRITRNTFLHAYLPLVSCTWK